MAETQSETLTPLTATGAVYSTSCGRCSPSLPSNLRSLAKSLGRISSVRTFSVAPGLFMTAAHVVTEAQRMGTSLSLDLGRLLTMCRQWALRQ